MLTSAFIGLKNPNLFCTKIDVRSTLARECHLVMLMCENLATEHNVTLEFAELLTKLLVAPGPTSCIVAFELYSFREL